MQVLPPQPLHYLPLSLLLLFQLASTSTDHLVILGLIILLRPNTTRNYCNAAVSILLSLLLLPLNFYDASIVIFNSCSSDFWQMQIGVFVNWRFWLFLWQAIGLVLWIRYCCRCYKEYRGQMLACI